MTEYQTAKELRPATVERYGEDSPAVEWLDKLISDGVGKPLAVPARAVWPILQLLHDGELEV